MKRIALDAAMLAGFLLAMSFQFLPKGLHEALGVLLPVLALWHLALNRAWLAALRRGRWTRLRALSALIDGLLLAVLVAVAATGLCISQFLLKTALPVEVQRSLALHQLHVSLPWPLLILIGLHLGLHWQALGGKRFGARPRLGRSLAAALAALGVLGSFMNRVGGRLALQHIFATDAVRQPFPVFLLLLCGIVGLYASAGHYARRLLLRIAEEKR